jgi:hypothetical protein
MSEEDKEGNNAVNVRNARKEQNFVRMKSKGRQVLESRKAWAGLIGVGATAALWWMGEIDGARAVEAMGWVLGIFIGSVALEDGMARLFASLSGAVREETIKVEAVKRETGEKANLSLK